MKNMNDMKNFENVVQTGSNSESLGEEFEEVYKSSQVISFEDKTIPLHESNE